MATERPAEDLPEDHELDDADKAAGDEPASPEEDTASPEEAASPEEDTASPEDFEDDPSRNPDDQELEEVKGG